ncbi:hypothetical protein PVAP13_9KG645750 [Panicum virgatum]|uniref:Uncharacterized protein n=1 Tax=Panicum virgatum TaxID=38727 RepID=A0A8T0NX60_PANVG|nr:hypothetical protein PVAP13_9KG645750 [Panicum virgatum]
MRSILVIRISLSIFSLPSCPAIFHSLPTPSRLDSCRVCGSCASRCVTV